MEVGVKELRDTLIRQLAEVQTGHTGTVTDHGRPITRIVPIGQLAKLEQLGAEGRIGSPSERKRAVSKPVGALGTVSDLVDRQRR